MIALPRACLSNRTRTCRRRQRPPWPVPPDYSYACVASERSLRAAPRCGQHLRCRRRMPRPPSADKWQTAAGKKGRLQDESHPGWITLFETAAKPPPFSTAGYRGARTQWTARDLNTAEAVHQRTAADTRSVHEHTIVLCSARYLTQFNHGEGEGRDSLSSRTGRLGGVKDAATSQDLATPALGAGVALSHVARPGRVLRIAPGVPCLRRCDLRRANDEALRRASAAETPHQNHPWKPSARGTPADAPTCALRTADSYARPVRR